MVRRLCILCFLLALWPGLALAQSAALMEAFNQFHSGPVREGRSPASI